LLSKKLVSAVPKARSAARQAENLAAAQLVLSAADLAAMAGLPKNRRFVNPDFAPAWDSPPA
jgi:2,5-diketo-D-gluconate reductase B